MARELLLKRNHVIRISRPWYTGCGHLIQLDLLFRVLPARLSVSTLYGIFLHVRRTVLLKSGSVKGWLNCYIETLIAAHEPKTGFWFEMGC